jgi:trigger factor
MSMQVTETAVAGLKREYRVVVPATDLEARVKERLDDLKDRVQLRGFRPGKVPVSHLKRIYGKSAMAEVIESAVREANDKIVSDHGFKLATEPKVVLPSEEGAVEGVIAGKSDLAYTVEMEIVPPIALTDFKAMKLDRLTAEVTDAEVDQAVQAIAEQNRPFGTKAESAEKGDRLTISFQGTIDGKSFEGGSAEDVPVLLGAGRFLPGFEDNLIGVKAGESRTFGLKFPDNYPAADIAGKEASFAVDVKTVEAPGAVTLNDDFAKTLGLDSLAKLRDALRERIQRDHNAASRQKLKRALLDQLDERHKFEPPPSLVEQEFNNVWSAIENDLKEQGRSFADEGTTEEKARADYRAIAERRVRLGLVIAEIGEKNNITVTEEQLRAAVMDQVRQLPGREQQVWDYYRNNPGALAALRAPLFEDKVVDFVLELAEVADKPVSRDELFKEEAE